MVSFQMRVESAVLNNTCRFDAVHMNDDKLDNACAVRWLRLFSFFCMSRISAYDTMKRITDNICIVVE